MKNHTESVSTMQYTYTAVFEPLEEGGYFVHFPAIANLATQGETLEEARAMAIDCLECYLGALQDNGEPFPVEEITPNSVLERVQVELKTV